jgi:archaellum biogenesis protein FlaJ (TadC family)
MVSTALCTEKHNSAPAQVEPLFNLRDLGHTLLVIAGQLAAIAVILLLWVCKDLSYSPGWAHPIGYYFAITLAAIAILGVAGILLRRQNTRLN